ncbi:MAG: MBL fold metallo-hydrolase [Myxococcota bacterium]|nr:MBL fold metallo-hydrolase [Myxococcota bacterium]
MPVPFASLVEYLLRPRSRHANDVSTTESLNWRRGADDLPPGLELQWLGTAGFRIAYEGFQLLIDPYLTRRPAGELYRSPSLRADPELVTGLVPGADAVLVGHTHFDHALDVPFLSKEYGARVYGSSSLRQLMAIHGMADRAEEVEMGRTFEVGPFEVCFVESVHSKLFFGWKVPFEGELTCDHLDHLGTGQFRCGQVYGIHIRVAGVSFYHQGSANLIDDRIEHRGVDYFLMGIAGRGFTRDYTDRILRRLEPRVVIPQHFDDFHRPVAGEMGFSLNVNLGGFVEEVERVSRDFEVRTLEPLQTVGKATTPAVD